MYVCMYVHMYECMHTCYACKCILEPQELGVHISHLITKVQQPQAQLVLGRVTILTGVIAKSV